MAKWELRYYLDEGVTNKHHYFNTIKEAEDYQMEDLYINNNMYYYTFNNDIEQVCNALNSYGFTKDRWSCEDKDAKGIGLVIYSVDDNCSIVKRKKYALLSERMMSKDPIIGWVEPYRKEVKNLQEFLDICSNLA